MTVKIPLRLQGIDLRDTEAYGRVPSELEELFWMANGAVSLAVVLSDSREVVAAADAADWARRIAKQMPGFLRQRYTTNWSACRTSRHAPV